ncbi:MAG: DsbA family protein [Pseudomonadota bacterium]
MTDVPRVDMWYSLQSDYCYFLIDRLLKLSAAGVEVVIRPVLGLVLRMPELTNDRPQIAQDYFAIDAAREAEFLGLPHVYPDPSPIQFEPGSFWIASKDQPRVERLFCLFVGATRAGQALPFLDKVVRHLWDGSQPGWDKSRFLYDALAGIGLDHDKLLATNDWASVSSELEANHHAMLDAGHWGVPLMVYEGEPFYGQDRFDQLLWRMGIKKDHD